MMLEKKKKVEVNVKTKIRQEALFIVGLFELFEDPSKVYTERI